MANQHHPDKVARTYRLHRDLVARMRTAATARDMTEVALVVTALEQYLPADIVVPPPAPDDTRRCLRARCTRAIPDDAPSKTRYCTTRCQVADWREQKRREEATTGVELSGDASP